MVGVAAGVAGVPSIQTCKTSLRLILVHVKFVSSGEIKRQAKSISIAAKDLDNSAASAS